MRVVNHEGQSREQWRPGVTTRMRVSALTGSAQLCVFEQWCEPSCGAPIGKRRDMHRQWHSLIVMCVKRTNIVQLVQVPQCQDKDYVCDSSGSEGVRKCSSC
jgi:hypothetical protein